MNIDVISYNTHNLYSGHGDPILTHGESEESIPVAPIYDEGTLLVVPVYSLSSSVDGEDGLLGGHAGCPGPGGVLGGIFRFRCPRAIKQTQYILLLFHSLPKY